MMRQAGFLFLLFLGLGGAALAQEHEHSDPVVVEHDCKCGPDCTCDPCGCDEFISDAGQLIANYAYEPTTVTVKDGDWFDPAIWSAGVPDADDVFKLSHAVRIAEHKPNGDLNGDGVLDAKDYQDWDGTHESIRRFLDAYFGLVIPSAGDAHALHGMVGKRGSLSIAATGSLSIGTLHVLGTVRQEGNVSIRDIAIDTNKDAMQWGIGVLVHSGGRYISRGGKVYSENPLGTRGHFLVMHSGTADLEGTEYADLGRTLIGPLDNTQIKDGVAVHIGTNQMARYGGPHFHHCWGPPGLPADEPQFRMVGCHVHDGTKWGITIHQSHYGLVEGNTVERCGGAGISFEDGNEYGNTVSNNVIRDVFGDGRGQQGHNNGQNVTNVGDGSEANPFRTLGSHGNEGAGIWGRCTCNNLIGNAVYTTPIGMSFWSRFQPNDSVKIPAAKGERPSVVVAAGSQLDHEFRDNLVEDCSQGMALQGLVGVFTAKGQKITRSRLALDTSYNGTLRFVDATLQNCTDQYKNGFTGKLELINCVVTGGNGGFDIPGRIYVEGGVFDTRKTTFGIAYKHVGSQQASMELRGPRFTGPGPNLAFVLGDLNKERGYHAPLDVFCYDWNGVPGDNFQVFLPQQEPNYVPIKTTTHNVRITPEPGITNAAMLDKYLLCLNGRLVPPDAVSRPGIQGRTTPIPAAEDLVAPAIQNLTQEITANSITVRFTTTKPARFRSEWNVGDIKWGKYANLVLPVGKEFKTEHEFTITGLASKTKYNYIIHVLDERGNLGGDTRTASLNYLPRTFTTK